MVESDEKEKTYKYYNCKFLIKHRKYNNYMQGGKVLESTSEVQTTTECKSTEKNNEFIRENKIQNLHL